VYKDEEVHSGPYWPSAAANIDFEAYEDRDVDALVAEINVVGDTYVTLVGDSVTHDHDTDSDTDTGSEGSQSE